MKEKKRKTFRKRIKRIIRRILMYRKSISFYSKISFIVIVETGVILFFYLSDILRITKEMLYWLFAATSQSMAALFAVVGMFAVFRHQNLDNKLRNLYDSLKRKFSLHSWIHYFGATGAESWEDSYIANRAEELLKMKEGRLPGGIKADLNMNILIIRHYERARDEVLVRAKIPLVAVLITFVLSIIFIPLTESISKNVFGLIILIIVLALITFSMINLFYYLVYSISPRRKKKEKRKKI